MADANKPVTAASRYNLDPKAQAELADLMVDLSNDKATRPIVNKFLKEKTGKVMQDVELEDVRASVKKEFEDRDLAEKTERAKQKLEAQRQGLIDSGRFTEEQVVAMEKDVMEKHAISDYNIAAKVFVADLPPKTPDQVEGDRYWNMPKMTKEDIANPKHVAHKRAMDAVGEVIRNRKRAH